jgi:hypothetical protein
MTPEERKKYNQKYYEKNREKILAGYHADPEERRKHGREYARKMVDENPEYAKSKKAYRIKWASENPGKIKVYEKRNREASVVKRLASQAVKIAVRSGHLLKPRACESCGKILRIHGHHDDYSKPLAVRWLCQICHLKIHRK